jgi:DNA-binding response OmpR family regulator
LADDEADLYVVAAETVGDVASRGAPVIAWGPAGLMRAAFLLGCVDYMREPWTPEELELRARAVLARVPRSHAFPWGELRLDGDSLALPAAVVQLTRHEARILRTLLRARGETVPREALAYAVDGTARRASGRSIDVHVSAIRRKVRAAAPAAGRFIVCVRGMGYLIP